MKFTLTQHELPLLFSALNLQKNRGIYLLEGDLASGKTTFVQEFAKFIQADCLVVSPTFLLMQDYGHGLFHYDLYQKDLESLLALGLLEELEKEGWHFVEWGDEKLATILKRVGLRFCKIQINPNKEARDYIVQTSTTS